jgi:hypothetical protein
VLSQEWSTAVAFCLGWLAVTARYRPDRKTYAVRNHCGTEYRFASAAPDRKDGHAFSAPVARARVCVIATILIVAIFRCAGLMIKIALARNASRR